jgi:hypothetical protein
VVLDKSLDLSVTKKNMKRYVMVLLEGLHEIVYVRILSGFLPHCLVEATSVIDRHWGDSGNNNTNAAVVTITLTESGIQVDMCQYTCSLT